MVFAYYKKLPAAQKKIYRASDAIDSIPLPDAVLLHPLIVDLAKVLERGDTRATGSVCRKIVTGITQRLDLPPIRTKVLAARPHDDYGELHGLYEPEDAGCTAVITLWMRTARKRKVVAFKSFLRTLLHEICHHVDYELYGLADSFHTEGFYKRESSLFHQLVPEQSSE